MGAGKVIEGLVEALAKEAPKGKKAAKPFFPVGSEERAANLDAFFGETHPNYRQRYYTGTSKDRDFTAFQESRHGTWLTSSPEEASDYALQNDSMNLRPIPGSWSYERVNSASRVIPTHVRVTNPYTGELPDFARADNYKKAQSDWFDMLRAQGYDAWAPESRKGDLLVVLKDQGTNVKSAIGNNGAFDRTKKHMGYSVGGVVRDFVEGVAREAPELSRGATAARRAMINIGLDINGGERLLPEQALEALSRLGVKPVRAIVAQSDTEPTLVVELERSLSPIEAHKLSEELKQEAIAQVDEAGVGELHGPSADKWKPFNGDYFLDPDGKRLSQAIMDAGSGEKPGYAGGGIIREAVEGLMEAAGRNADEAADLAKPMRLYHGTRNWDEARGVDAGFDHLSPDIQPSQLGLHVGSVPQANYFGSGKQAWDEADYLLNKEYFSKTAPTSGRVIPLDVQLKNPVRLEDRTGHWKPTEIYKQLTKRNIVPYDSNVALDLHVWQNSDKKADKIRAMKYVRSLIEDAGHDGVVYTNRVEGHGVGMTEVGERFEKRGMSEIGSSDKDWLEVVPEAQGNDSYIVWKPESYRSPFGDGPGVGYANGGVVRKLGQGLVDLFDFSGVTGKPSTVKIPGYGEHAAAPIAEIDDAAEAYMRRAGIPGTHRIGEYPELDEAFSRKIADQYDALKHDPADPDVSRAYEALLDETMDQYRALKDTGLDIRFLKDGMDDPYAASPSMGYADMVNNGRLWVFPTSQGYGSGAEVFEHPLLKKVGKVGDLEDATANDAFRVVHDAYGHFGPGNPFFRAAGEDRAWMHHARMYSDDALPAMSAETRGQNSWVNYGPKARENKGASGASTIYADQKAVAMPRWVYEKDLGRIPKFAEGGRVPTPEEIASMTHEDSYGVGSRPSSLTAFGEEFDLGEGPVYYRDGEEYAPKDNVQDFWDMKTLPLYATPAAPIAAASDFTEGMLSDDPLTMALSVAGGVPGKVYKAGAKAVYEAAKKPVVAGTAAAAAGVAANTGEAEAGIYGTLAKWAQSREGQSLLGRAMKMERAGEDPELIRKQTQWFKDLDGQWKFELPSAGSKADLSLLKGGRLDSFYYDPHLFDQYPDLAGLKVRRVRDAGAYYDPQNDYIGIGDISSDYFKRPEMGGAQGVVAHEVYHKKAFDEGWPAKGSNELTEMSRLRKDAERFANYQHLDPAYGQAADYLNNKILNSNTNIGGLAGAKYTADLGEVLARREGRRRNLTEEMIRMGSPLDDIDIPHGAIFDNTKLATPDQYRNLINFIKQRQLEGKGMP